MQRQSRVSRNMAATKAHRKSRPLESVNEEPQPIRISLANQYPRPLPPPPPDVLNNPESLINRPKSAYTRNRRMDDEEPVFWQHSNRSTKLLRQSELSNLRPKSLTIKKQQEELRRSNGSAFENFINRTFASQPSLNLPQILPNPLINIQPPSTPSLPPTPIDGNQISQQRVLPSTRPDLEFTREILDRSRFSKTQNQSSEKRSSWFSQDLKRSSAMSQDQKRFSGLSQEQKRASGLSLEPRRASGLSLEPRRASGLSLEPTRASVLSLEPNRFSSSSKDLTRFSGIQDQSSQLESSASLEQPSQKRFSGSSQETPKSKRYSGFRPLQLSFYLPGNRLSLLPQFSDDNDEVSDIPPMPEIPRPASALMKAKPSVISDRPSTYHSIPRKAVGSQTTSLAGGSTRSSFQSSVTLNNTLYSRSSLLQDPVRSDARLSTGTWRNTQDFQKAAENPPPSPRRPMSRIFADAAEILATKRRSTHSIHLETQVSASPPQPEYDECSPISEESSPVSPVSPMSPVSPATAPIKHHSTVDYHDYDFAPPTPQPRTPRSAVDYHEYEFTTPTRTPTTPAFSTRDSTMKVSPLFHNTSAPPPPPASEPSSDEEDELPPNSKPRSSSGSSTLYHGEFSSEEESDLVLPPAVKHALSVDFPSPTIQHRLSDWLVRSAGIGHHHAQSWNPPRGAKGEVYAGERGPDSPTLGFSWKDFGCDGVEKGGDGRKKRPLTVGGEKYLAMVEGEDFDLEKFPMPGGVGVAY